MAAVLVATARAPTARLSDGCGRPADWPVPNAALEAQVVALVNADRRWHGLPALVPSATLTRAAQWKASHMARYRYMRHNDLAPPVKRTAQTRLAACGYPTTRTTWGENIAFGYATPAAVMKAWLRSRDHRLNMEFRRFAAIGVGSAQATNGVVYWAQDFGSYAGAPPGRGRPRPTAPPPPPPPAGG